MAPYRIERVGALIYMNILVIYALWMLMAYLTSVWDLSISHAAAIVNVFWSFYTLGPFFLPILIHHTFIGNYWMVFISTVSMPVGMGLLTMSTPPVLAKSIGNCSDYSSECIGQGQKVLFYIALPLIAFGMAGYEASLGTFVEEQFNGEEEIRNIAAFVRINKLADPIFTCIAVLGLSYVKPWSLRFGVPAICSLVATLLFFSASCSFKFIRPTGTSPFTLTFFKVIVAAFSKLFYTIPTYAYDLFEIQDDPQLHLVPHSMSLRCLDKAAIVIPRKPITEQIKWRLCRVTEVEETKAIIRTIPVWLTLVLCGVVASMAHTFFIEQLDNMNPKLGRLKVPILVLIWFQSEVVHRCASFCIRLAKNFFRPRLRMSGFVGVVVSMILAALCCITCGAVENRRLGGLALNHHKEGTMSMFWLVPQMVLFGVFRGIFEASVFCLLHVKGSEVVVSKYLAVFVNCVFSVGFLGNSVLVFVVGKISERGGKMSWFQHELNESRLDKYYYTLAWLMAVNLVVFIVVVTLYRCNEWKVEDEQAAESGETDNSPKCCFCCC